ncbi:hypothetical protein GQ53DRAFT_756415 [Thozetella sp. PMI_491]|nr:hypothetical protein GQ53DRAFT_756415 [Thozetella sp. PMI_491]
MLSWSALERPRTPPIGLFGLIAISASHTYHTREPGKRAVTTVARGRPSPEVELPLTLRTEQERITSRTWRCGCRIQQGKSA